MPFGLNTYYEGEVMAKEHVYKHGLNLENTTPWYSDSTNGWGRFYVDSIGDVISEKEYINQHDETVEDKNEIEYKEESIEIVEFDEWSMTNPNAELRLNHFDKYYCNTFLAGVYSKENDEKLYCIKCNIWYPNREDWKLTGIIGDMWHYDARTIMNNSHDTTPENDVRTHFISTSNGFYYNDFDVLDVSDIDIHDTIIKQTSSHNYGILSGEAEGTYKYEGFEDLAYKAKTTVTITNYANHYDYSTPEKWAKACCDIWALENGYSIVEDYNE